MNEHQKCGSCPYFTTTNISPLVGMTGSCGVLLLRADEISKQGFKGKIGACILRFFARNMWTPLNGDCRYTHLTSKPGAW